MTTSCHVEKVFRSQRSTAGADHRGGPERPSSRTWFGACRTKFASCGLLGLRNDADVGLRRLPLAEDLLGIVVRDGPGDDHVVALLPLSRRRDLVLRGELQRVDDPKHLVEVA